jgi:hypothetical protein
MPASLSFKRMLAGWLLLSLSLAGLFTWMAYLRLISLDNSGLGACLELDPLRLHQCMNWTIHAHLWNSHWVALQFSLYVVVALLISLFLCRKAPSAPLFHGLMMASLSALSLLGMTDQGRLIALCAFVGALLGGLIAHSLRNRQNPNSRIDS